MISTLTDHAPPTKEAKLLISARTVSWPARGDASAFRKRTVILASLISLTITAPLLILELTNPGAIRSSLPLAIGVGLLAALWIHGAARSYARQRELERSFAGLIVLHLGKRYRISATPYLGSFTSRKDACEAALLRGHWAAVVRAWDRYWLLQATPVHDRDHSNGPVSFRSRAIADIIPAIRDSAA